VPNTTETLEGLTEIETNAGGVTVRVVLPVTPFEFAVIVVVPVVKLVASPAALIVATVVFEEVQLVVLITVVVPLL
jgi:hypothetical protein